MAVLMLNDIHKSYQSASEPLRILNGLSLTISPGQMVALTGPSGSGKTTLLQIASLLDRPDQGRIAINGIDASQANEATRTKLRREHLGFVYQFHHLLPEFTALENVAMPLIVGGTSQAQAQGDARELLAQVGLADRAKHAPDQLSGGEQQRVAIARALIGNPALLIADEPTGNLDPDNAQRIIELLLNICKSKGLAVLMATHNMALADQLDAKLLLYQGIIK